MRLARIPALPLPRSIDGEREHPIPTKKRQKRSPITCKRTDGLKRLPRTTNNFANTLIHQLVAQRTQMGRSQAQVNETIGVAEGLVAKWETGLRRPSGFLLFCWAEALECDLLLVPKYDG